MQAGNSSPEKQTANRHIIYCPKVYDSFMIELLSSGMDEETILEVYPELAPGQRIECEGCLVQYE
jgi:hypothetical protein